MASAPKPTEASATATGGRTPPVGAVISCGGAAAPPRAGADRDPGAAARLDAARGVVQELAERYALPVENVLQPDALRRLCWTPPEPADAAGIVAFLRGRGAREWQVGLVAEPLADAFERAGER